MVKSPRLAGGSAVPRTGRSVGDPPPDGSFGRMTLSESDVHFASQPAPGFASAALASQLCRPPGERLMVVRFPRRLLRPSCDRSDDCMILGAGRNERRHVVGWSGGCLSSGECPQPTPASVANAKTGRYGWLEGCARCRISPLPLGSLSWRLTWWPECGLSAESCCGVCLFLRGETE